VEVDDVCSSESSHLELTPVENAALAQAEFDWGATVLRSTPPLLTIETTSRCNLRCVMCPHAYGQVHRPKHLDENLANKTIKFLRHASEVQLHGIGEPTNSPAFWRMLRDLPAPDICSSSINTNFTVIDDRRLNELLNSSLKIINISLDAACETTYRRVRGYSFKIVIDNIERLIKGRQERGQLFPKVYLNMTLMRSNIEEVCDFVRLGARLGVELLMLGHLNRYTDEQVADYVTERDGWKFDYAREGLWNFPALSNRCLREAVTLSNELGVQLVLDANKDVYFDE
jgi:MoaA/NifB/PqqE/SkfB family radical SAM enzyme